MIKGLTRISNSYKISKEIIATAYNLGKNHETVLSNQKLLYTISGIPVYLNNDFFKVSGRLVAVTTSDMLTGQPMILVDDHFLSMDPSTQNFVILHEIGHIKMGHLRNAVTFAKENKNRRSFSKKGIVAPVEIAADRYATVTMGAVCAVHALESLQELMDKYTGNKEILFRIKAIQSI